MGDRHERDLVPSPGGWKAPPGARPGRDWLPPIHGAQPAPERLPWWVRVWCRIPFFDRFAHEWMWFHGGFLVLPAGHPFHQGYGPEEYEALTGMSKATYERECVRFARDAFAEDGNGFGFADADVELEGDGLDTELVVRVRIDGRPGRFGSRTRLWPSPHPDDYEGTPDWAQMLPSLLHASIDSPSGADEADEQGIVWI